MNWYQLHVDHVSDQLHVNPDKGLGHHQATKRLQKFGQNVLEKEKQQSKWLLLFKQFQDFMVVILLAATLIAGLLGEFVDAIAIMVIIMVNSFIGFFQEQKAENSLAKLKQLSAPVASVLRDGKWVRVLSQEIVCGDVIHLTSGERVPADIRLSQLSGLEIEESALTGESLPVNKQDKALPKEQLDPQDQLNMAFMGTLVTKGNGIGIVVGTGMQTVMGQIASLMVKTKHRATPLEQKLAELGKILIVVALFLTACVVMIGVYHGQPIYHMFLAGVSLAVAAIPEGLPAIVTVALSLGVQRMIRKKAIVRKLSAVETLGCASVICSDKTGTMTENQMTVKHLFLNGEYLYVTGDGYDVHGGFFLNKSKVSNNFANLADMLTYGAMCNHASLWTKKGKYGVEGDPTDGALLVAARKMGINLVGNDFQILKELPFDSERKRMSVIIQDHAGKRFLITKGAPDVLLPRVTSILDERGKRRMTSTDHEQITGAVDHMADQALRTIAIAIKPLNRYDEGDNLLIENELTFVGLFGMIDPPRKEVKQAIQSCLDAGIKTVMITGDHLKTAQAIAKNLNLIPKDGRVLDGNQLNHMSDEELVDIIDDVYVFARVTPGHKLKIVNALQEKGHIVAMTGDGVNDAPAIKASNIGISMGRTGTDVAKEASSLILLDDNFTTIKAAIEEGRNIYENIRKFVRYLLASNVGEILVMLLAMVLALPLPLVPVQILWVNLVTDGLPAMALGMDKPESDVMQQPPRHQQEGIFARRLGFKIVTRGIMIGVSTLLAFMITYHYSSVELVHAQTVAFTTLVLAQLIQVFDCRSEHSIFSRNPFGNVYLVLAVLSSFVLLVSVIYLRPLQPIFHTTYLGLMDWLLIIFFSAMPTVLFGYNKNR